MNLALSIKISRSLLQKEVPCGEGFIVNLTGRIFRPIRNTVSDPMRSPIPILQIDNAYVESFFGKLKTELVHGERYRTRLEARLSIFKYVEVFYNRQRSHSALGYSA